MGMDTLDEGQIKHVIFMSKYAHTSRVRRGNDLTFLRICFLLSVRVIFVCKGE